MLRITTSHSAEAAKNYFDVALKTGDYYTKDVGIWGGKGAEILGLEGEVERKDFVALANNKWPGVNGKRLTARMNKTRLEDVIDRRPGGPRLIQRPGRRRSAKSPTGGLGTISRSARPNRSRYIWPSMRTRLSSK